MRYTIAKVWDTINDVWWTAPSGKSLWLTPRNAQIAISSWNRDEGRRRQLRVTTAQVEFKPPHGGSQNG